MAPERSLVDSIRLRAKLWAHLIATLISTLLAHAGRKLTGAQHALGWSLQQDLSIAMLRSLFTVGSYVHWRHFIYIMRKAGGPPVDLNVQHVAAKQYTRVPGARASWWLELKPGVAHPVPPRARCCLMFLHGGAFMAGHPRMYQDAFASLLKALAAEGVAARLFTVGYALAPEQPFPAGLRSVCDAYRFLASQLEPDTPVILVGDSAGANLLLTSLAAMRDGHEAAQPCPAAAAATAAAAPRGGGNQPSEGGAAAQFAPPLAAIAVSPAADFTERSVFGQALLSSQAHGQQRPGAGKPLRLRESSFDYLCADHTEVDIAELYAPSTSLHDPLVSPILLPSFVGLVSGELLIVSGGAEIMAADIRRLHARMAAEQGVRVSLHEEPGQPHCWPLLALGPLVQRGCEVMVPFITRQLLGSSAKARSE